MREILVLVFTILTSLNQINRAEAQISVKKLFHKPDQKNQLHQNSVEKDAVALPEWEPMGPYQNTIKSQERHRTDIGRVTCLWVDHENTDILLAGSHGGGLWKTTDGGKNWTCLTEHLHGGIASIEVDPYDNNIIYIITGISFSGFSLQSYATGVYKSTNGGSDFIPAHEGIDAIHQYYMNEILVDPTNPSILYAVAENTVYKSYNSGQSWDKLAIDVKVDIFRQNNLLDITIDPNHTNILFASGENQLWHTDDAGLSWSNITSDLTTDSINRIAVSINNESEIFAYYCDFKKNSKIYKSSTQNLSWIPFCDHYGLNSGEHWVCTLIISPEKNIFAGGRRIFKYDSTGSYLGRISPATTHMDVNDIVFANGLNEDLVYVATDGGISVSTDEKGLEFVSANGNLNINQIYDVAILPDHPHLIVAGAHDNYSFMYSSKYWESIGGGDGGRNIISSDFSNDGITYSMTSRNVIQYKNGRRIRSLVSLPAYNSPIMQHPTNPDKIYFGNWNVMWTSPDCGKKNPCNFSKGGQGFVTAIAICDNYPDYFYFSKFKNYPENQLNGSLFRTTDNGTSWKEINMDPIPLRNRYPISSIWVDPNDPDRFMITFSGLTESPKVYICQKDNKSEEWKNFSSGLPQFPVNKIIKDHSTGFYYVATDMGVYIASSLDEEWIEFNDGLPKVMVTDIEINPKTHELIAATYGRGIWKTCLHCMNFNNLTVNQDLEYTFDLNVCGDLIVESGAKLSIYKALKLNDHTSNIIVKNEGTLILNDGAVVYNRNSDAWQGDIVIQPGGKLILKENARIKIAGKHFIAIDNKRAGMGIMEIYPDATIHLKDSVTRLNNFGQIHLWNNAELHNTGSGSITNNGIITKP